MTNVRSRSTARTDATVLAFGSIASGLAAYGFVVLGTHRVGSEAFAPVSVLWSLWAISAAAITFPVQHWVIRTVEVHAGDESYVWSAAPVIWRVTVTASFVAFLATYSIGERLFSVPGVEYPLMAACLPIGSVMMGFNRGLLAARTRFAATAVATMGENALRVLLAATLIAQLSARTLGWILVAGFSVAFLFPSTIFRRHDGRSARGRLPTALLGGLAGANAAAQAVLTSGPVLLGLLGGASAAVTALFAMLAVLRAPHTFALGITARLTGPLTRLALEGGRSTLRRFEVRLLLVTAAGAVVAGGFGPVVLPSVTELVFGIDADFPPMVTALLAAGTVVALAGLLQMLLLLAEGRGNRLAGAWSAGAVVGGAGLLMPGDPVMRVSVAFALAESVALAAMVLRWERPRR